jgi:hypothetical protein
MFFWGQEKFHLRNHLRNGAPSPGAMLDCFHSMSLIIRATWLRVIPKTLVHPGAHQDLQIFLKSISILVARKAFHSPPLWPALPHQEAPAERLDFTNGFHHSKWVVIGKGWGQEQKFSLGF